MKTFTVTTDSTLKAFTDGVYPQGSFAYNALIKKGDIRVNGVKQKADCPVKAGDEIVYYTTPAQEAKPSHFMVYADDNLLIADKLSGVASEALFEELKGEAAYPVHRLDRNTAGLIVIAKTQTAQTALISAFKEREVEKIYLCLAKDKFSQPKATLTAYLKKDEKSKLVRIYAAPNADSVKIITEYEKVKSYGDYALVKVILHTGKTHQIRAHLASIGCPVLGDTKYGDFALNKKYSATRQILVAKYLKFNMGGEMSYLNALSFQSRFVPELPARH